MESLSPYFGGPFFVLFDKFSDGTFNRERRGYAVEGRCGIKMKILGIVPRSYGEVIGGTVAVASGILQGLLAIGFPRASGDSVLQGIYAVTVAPLGAGLLVHGLRLRNREQKQRKESDRR